MAGEQRLNSRRALFAKLLFEGENGNILTDVECYKRAGYAWKTYKPNTLAAAVSRTKNNPAIKAEIERLQALADEQTIITKESIAEELEEARELARLDTNPSAMVAASMGKAKLFGLDKVVVEVKPSEELTPWTSVVAGVSAAVGKDAT